jgi:hypothetical protein
MMAFKTIGYITMNQGITYASVRCLTTDDIC